jgi:hypothetical protein
MKYALALIASLFLFGCEGGSYQSYAEYRNRNRSNLAKIEAGMSKSRVLEIMGSETHYTMTNPYKAEFIPTKGGMVEVLYYYTDYINYDRGEDEMDGMTPIVIKDNKVIGWGRKMLDDTDFRQTLRIERR